MTDYDKFEITQKHKKVIVYRVQSRYPFINYDTLLDLYNDVCFHFLRNFDSSKVHETNAVYTYLLTSLTNACKNWIRDVNDALEKGNCLSLEDLREQSGEEHEVFQEEALIEDPYTRMEDLQYADYVYALILQGLPKTLRLIVHLFYIEEMKLRDIMRELRVLSMRRMGSMFRRARKLLVLRLLEIKQMRRDGLL